jgi:Ni/Co efflux regulator RcnB
MTRVSNNTKKAGDKKSAWKLLVPLLLSMTLVASPAMADDDDDDDDRRGWRQHHGYDRDWNDRDRSRDDRRDWRQDRRQWERYQRERAERERQWQREQARRWEQQRRWQQQRERDYYRSAYYAPRPVVRYAGPPAWVRGRDYRSYGYNNVYYVPYNDYNRYGLYAPGYGQRWLRDDGGNFLLVAAATGIIASILDR